MDGTMDISDSGKSSIYCYLINLLNILGESSYTLLDLLNTDFSISSDTQDPAGIHFTILFAPHCKYKNLIDYLYTTTLMHISWHQLRVSFYSVLI